MSLSLWFKTTPSKTPKHRRKLRITVQGDADLIIAFYKLLGRQWNPNATPGYPQKTLSGIVFDLDMSGKTGHLLPLEDELFES